MKSYDVVVVGAGPAGIAAARFLSLGSSLTVAIFDSGSHYEKRSCAVDSGNKCKHCKSGCKVISGFGGAIHYGDAVKLSKFPSGKRLETLLGKENAISIMDSGCRLLFPNVTEQSFSSGDKEAVGVQFKKYPVAEVSSCKIQESIKYNYNSILSENNVSLYLETTVNRIQFRDDAFTLELLRAEGKKLIQCRYLIVATGRQGLEWWKKQQDELSLKYSLPVFSIGVRFIAPPTSYRAAGISHADFKFSRTINNTKFKTFCFCAGEGGGRLKFVNYGQYTLLDGHILTTGPSSSENFAILAQLMDENNTPHTLDWLNKHILAPYIGLSNNAHGRPVLQSYNNFKSKVKDEASVSKLFEYAKLSMEATDFQLANISDFIPNHIHSGLCTTYEDFMEKLHPDSIQQSLLDKTLVSALEIEGFWNEMKLNEHMESSQRNLFIAGDATGIAQGILQAVTGGVAAANGILKKEFSSLN